MIAAQPLRSLTLLLCCALLAACAGRSAPPTSGEPIPLPPAGTPAPVPVPEPTRPVITPAPGQPAANESTSRCSHPRYAPPPGTRSCWDGALGVYRVEGAELFYRQRVFYRWDGQWYSAGSASGPWEATAMPSVPPGLRSLHGGQ